MQPHLADKETEVQKKKLDNLLKKKCTIRRLIGAAFNAVRARFLLVCLLFAIAAGGRDGS
jgi:hypothetical protein